MRFNGALVKQSAERTLLFVMSIFFVPVLAMLLPMFLIALPLLTFRRIGLSLHNCALNNPIKLSFIQPDASAIRAVVDLDALALGPLENRVTCRANHSLLPLNQYGKMKPACETLKSNSLGLSQHGNLKDEFSGFGIKKRLGELCSQPIPIGGKECRAVRQSAIFLEVWEGHQSTMAG
jgi:hypothetical protein